MDENEQVENTEGDVGVQEGEVAFGVEEGSESKVEETSGGDSAEPVVETAGEPVGE